MRVKKSYLLAGLIGVMALFVITGKSLLGRSDPSANNTGKQNQHYSKENKNGGRSPKLRASRWLGNPGKALRRGAWRHKR